MALLDTITTIAGLINTYGLYVVIFVLIVAMYYLSNKNHIKSLEKFNAQYVEVIMSLKEWLDDLKTELIKSIEDGDKELSASIVNKMDKIECKLDAIILNNSIRGNTK